jgi:anion-transporting  ArsA/GET3 family ATPase
MRSYKIAERIVNMNICTLDTLCILWEHTDNVIKGHACKEGCQSREIYIKALHFTVMPISIEEVYVSALKKQIQNWKKEIIQKEEGTNNVIQEKKTPEHVMRTIKTFLFNETLYTEITKAALLMCGTAEPG